MPYAPKDASHREHAISEPRSTPAESADGVKQFIRGEGSVGSQVGRASIRFGGTVVLKLLVFAVLVAGGVSGVFLGEKLFPRNDPAQYACAAVLGAVPAGFLWWLGTKLLTKWSAPK